MSITSQIEVQDTDVKCIEVEEWLLNGEPLKIFFTPMTVKDQKNRSATSKFSRKFV